MSLRLPLNSLESFDALLLGVNRKIISPLQGPLMGLGEGLVLIFQEGLHLHLLSRFPSSFSLIFLLLGRLLNAHLLHNCLRAMQVPLDLFQLRRLFTPIFGVGVRFFWRLLTCVEINQCVGCTRQFFTKSFLGDDAAVLARSSGEEPASPRHRAGVASMAWRTTRRFGTNAP